MATDNDVAMARQHGYEQGYELGFETGAGKTIADLAESRDHPGDCACQPCGARRWICGGKSPGEVIADRVRDELDQARKDEGGEL